MEEARTSAASTPVGSSGSGSLQLARFDGNGSLTLAAPRSYRVEGPKNVTTFGERDNYTFDRLNHDVAMPRLLLGQAIGWLVFFFGIHPKPVELPRFLRRDIMAASKPK